MFGIGTGELLLLLVLALIVLGPERMPRMARDIGKVVGDLRRTSDELRDEFLNADKMIKSAIDVPASQPASPSAPVTAQATEPAAPANPDETLFDREMREAKERLQRARDA
jgi:sec-independent protein translocase protein TatB